MLDDLNLLSLQRHALLGVPDAFARRRHHRTSRAPCRRPARHRDQLGLCQCLPVDPGTEVPRRAGAHLTDTDLSTDGIALFPVRAGGGGRRAGHGDFAHRLFRGNSATSFFIPYEYTEHLLRDAVVAAGAPFDLRVCGMKTMRSLRVEKRYLLYGLDVSTETDPLSAGVGLGGALR